MTGIPNLWDKKRIWPVVLAVVIVIMVILGGFFCYVRFTSYSSTSEDGMWQAGAYRPELSVNLWSGYLTYFGNAEDINDLKVTVKHKDSDNSYEYVPEPVADADFYVKLLAGKSFTCSYRFCSLSYGAPKFERITVHWTDADGTVHDYAFQF